MNKRKMNVKIFGKPKYIEISGWNYTYYWSLHTVLGGAVIAYFYNFLVGGMGIGQIMWYSVLITVSVVVWSRVLLLLLRAKKESD